MAQGLTNTKGVDGRQFSLRLDSVSGSLTFVGEASPNSAENAAVWRIKRLDESVNKDLTILWAGGTSDFDKIWSDRTSLSYS